ncbi:MAG: redox-regulated ATPase YchF [Candidatus Jacksonbacteria bacterium RIFCSPLOWO2_02_FULL_43_9]|nr:MAG: GTP-dependent nucleic acid-binding protein EngD [Parcubacteria group bacterium GW2011_GWA2_43_13]OGY68616.1 MAG: redox-regulated ATPase YchF [Candidatus Jacksonbacteria bacterium RIFCSPHIGHO2_02_FULL_43_10]OGY71404.1 MAG: redox-regulated ATPase YchF [Candidatus Jacksonbacteria bacterium RIFCSPLOWO2_01_FULL_44_13]OGY73152.1 MAG: redox-regulated ATPase YchF [Candidatus Jacksonbacteria bacterium RIFCSPLOWO2_02_FULL_43_9]HAZ17057.1 redox-regulated ATPase YchF [Candidatus Jacksonbacteria bac
MSLQIGIVGLPNVGKSTLFRALTKKQVAVENFPFCTIDPNVGVVAVPDDRLQKLSDISHSAQIIPTTIEFVDIAGLVKGAHKGEGLGNQFLSHIRGVDAICHVLRDFHNDDIIHVEGKVDPESDRETIITELAMADLAVVLKRIDTLEAKSRTGDKDALKELELFQTLEHILNNSTPISSQPFTDDKQILLKPYNLLTLKPIIEVYNSDEQPVETPPLGVSDEDAPLGRLYNTRLTICAKLEAELSELDQEEVSVYLKELGLNDTGLNRLIKKAYETLDLITFFTSGPKETRAWTIKKGAQAPEAAGVIHSDFEKYFIRAEVIAYQDFIEYNGEQGAKDSGKLRVEGKEYAVCDGDVMHFRHGA